MSAAEPCDACGLLVAPSGGHECLGDARQRARADAERHEELAARELARQLGASTVGELPAAAARARRRFVHAAKAAERTPLLRQSKRGRRALAAFDRLKAAVFLRTLELDYAGEDHAGDLPLTALEEPRLLLARWREAAARVHAASRAGELHPSRQAGAVDAAAALSPRGDAA